MSKKIKLNLIGITYNQIESGVYALILQQDQGIRRIPIIIGYPEAQAIECKLQDVKTPRPLTHDMTAGILNGFDIKLREVFIRHLENGVFAADMVLENYDKTLVLDTRSSDAIAMAIRTGAPIYTSEEVLDKAGFNPEDKKRPDQKSNIAPEQKSEPKSTTSVSSTLESLSINQLNQLLQNAVDAEDYAEAAKVKKELDRRDENKK